MISKKLCAVFAVAAFLFCFVEHGLCKPNESSSFNHAPQRRSRRNSNCDDDIGLVLRDEREIIFDIHLGRLPPEEVETTKEYEFFGTVRCKDGSPINHKKAMVYLVDYDTKEYSTIDFPLKKTCLYRTSSYTGESASFTMKKWMRHLPHNLMFYVFVDVCHIGQRVEKRAYHDGHVVFRI